MYSDDVPNVKASPSVKMNKPPRTREYESSERKGNQSKRNGHPMTVEVVAAINAAEQEAAEMEAMQRRERLLIRAMIGGFLLLVLGLARQHNPDDHGLNEGFGGDDGSLRGSSSFEWQGNRPNVAQHLTLGGDDSQDFHVKEISVSSEDEEGYYQYLDMIDYEKASGSDSQDSNMESLDHLNESFTNKEVSIESEDSAIKSESPSKDEEEQKPAGDEDYPIDAIDGRLETAEENGN